MSLWIRKKIKHNSHTGKVASINERGKKRSQPKCQSQFPVYCSVNTWTLEYLSLKCDWCVWTISVFESQCSESKSGPRHSNAKYLYVAGARAQSKTDQKCVYTGAVVRRVPTIRSRWRKYQDGIVHWFEHTHTQHHTQPHTITVQVIDSRYSISNCTHYTSKWASINEAHTHTQAYAGKSIVFTLQMIADKQQYFQHILLCSLHTQ